MIRPRPPARWAYTPEGHARFYEEVRQALGLGRVVLLGHSLGATTAPTYAALFPARDAYRRAILDFTGSAAASSSPADGSPSTG